MGCQQGSGPVRIGNCCSPHDDIAIETDPDFFASIPNPWEIWQGRVRTIGGEGCVAAFFQGEVTPDCCLVAFGKQSREIRMTEPEVTKFLEAVLTFFQMTPSASVQAQARYELHEFYHFWMTATFGELKPCLTRKDFWILSDNLKSCYESEKTWSQSQEMAMTTVFYRKQFLVEQFFLEPSPDDDLCVFNIFQSCPETNELRDVDVTDLVFHCVSFFVKYSNHECIPRPDALAGVVVEVLDDIAADLPQGADFAFVTFDEFLILGKGLKDIFSKLSANPKKKKESWESTCSGETQSTMTLRRSCSTALSDSETCVV